MVCQVENQVIKEGCQKTVQKLSIYLKKCRNISLCGKSAGRLVQLNYSDLAGSFSEMKCGSWLKTKDTFTSSFESQLNIAPTKQLLILVLCCYLLSESNYGNIFFSVQNKNI